MVEWKTKPEAKTISTNGPFVIAAKAANKEPNRRYKLRFDSFYSHDLTTGIMREITVLISDYWFQAAHIDYYVARRYGMQFMAIVDLNAIHHYAWLNKLRPMLKMGDDAYFISISNFYNSPQKSLSDQFEKTLDTTTITQYRSGVPVRNFFRYRLKKYRGNIRHLKYYLTLQRKSASC